jgi:hypothetical protein
MLYLYVSDQRHAIRREAMVNQRLWRIMPVPYRGWCMRSHDGHYRCGVAIALLCGVVICSDVIVFAVIVLGCS